MKKITTIIISILMLASISYATPQSDDAKLQIWLFNKSPRYIHVNDKLLAPNNYMTIFSYEDVTTVRELADIVDQHVVVDDLRHEYAFTLFGKNVDTGEGGEVVDMEVTSFSGGDYSDYFVLRSNWFDRNFELKLSSCSFIGSSRNTLLDCTFYIDYMGTGYPPQ